MKTNLASWQESQTSFLVSHYMTALPFTIPLEGTLRDAKHLMKDHSLRHLPVVNEDNFVQGIISSRDVAMIESFWNADPDSVKVKDFFVPDPLYVRPETPVRDVCALMSAKKIGSVLVMDEAELVGIFTWIDAVNALSGILDDRVR